MATTITNSTSAFYERARQDLTSLRTQAETIQGQISSKSRLSRSSDDPVAASRLRTLMRSDSLARIDTTNADRANADLTLTDAALSDFADYIIRAQELATQAASGTLTDGQRKTIGSELAAISGNMFALANARDSNGHALFGGESAGQAYQLNAAGVAEYKGTATSGDLPLGDGLTITRGITGPEFLNFNVGGASTDLLAVMKGLSDALQGGTDPAGAARGALDSLAAGLDSVTTAQTVVGSRLAWIDLTNERRTDLGELRSAEQEEVGGTDIATSVAQLQQTLTVLEASQASFSKLASLSLFDRIN